MSAVLAKLSKTYKGAIQELSTAGTVKRIFLESPLLNFIFGGGFGMGRIYEFSGPESGGKSTLATYIGGEIQKKNTDRPVVVYMDFEYSFDEKYANKLGLKTDADSFILLRPLSGEEGFEMLKELIEQLPIGLIIWDSLASTPSLAQNEDAFKATFGGGAKVFSNGLKFINPYLSRYDVPLIIINQERASMEKYGSAYSTPGGYAPKYYASWRGRITRIDDILEKGSLVGIVSKVRNTKNKIGIPKREAELQLKFASGFNSEEEYLNFLVPLGLVEQRGAWISNEDWGLKVCGKDNLLPFFKERPELFETVKHSVNSMLAGETNIDRENAAKATEDEEPEGPPPESD